MFNEFIWNRKKPRINMSVIQQETKKGGLALSNIKLYYSAAHLAVMAQWWVPSSKDTGQGNK